VHDALATLLDRPPPRANARDTIAFLAWVARVGGALPGAPHAIALRLAGAR
jgi:hypothetical protein